MKLVFVLTKYGINNYFDISLPKNYLVCCCICHPFWENLPKRAETTIEI